MRDTPLDCLVIGAGPAGLTAAIYLARYHLDIMVVDGGDSRAQWIPCTHNHAGYPDGIEGSELLKQMRTQAQKYGAEILRGRVSTLSCQNDGLFCADWGSGAFSARSVLLATGVKNRRPPNMTVEDHDAAMAKGLIRYCPVCDGYEVTDKRVGVIGTGIGGAGETRFLRGFTADLTLIAPDGPHDLADSDRAELEQAGVTLIDGPVDSIAEQDGKICVVGGKDACAFDSIYPALGSDMRSQLAELVGADLSDAGCILVDDHQRTSVDGMYAAGDVVIGLDQISNAMGQGGVASTTIRNDLAKQRPIRR